MEYGYQDDNVQSSLNFGLTAKQTFLKKMGWISNGGKDGADQEALDIVFEIDGSEKSNRKFPVTRAYHDGNEVTDPTHPAMINAVKELSSILVHIVGCFVTKDQIKAALSTPIASFKDYCNVLTGLLPENYDKIPLDIFMQWEWKIRGENDKTWLIFPKNMKQGRWLCPTAPVTGVWVEKRMESPEDKQKNALHYVDSENAENIHPFVRSGWFVNSTFSTQQRDDDGLPVQNALSNSAPETVAPPATQLADGTAAPKW